MEFWVNSGHDEPGSNGGLDKDLPVPPSAPKIGFVPELESDFQQRISGKMFIRTNAPPRLPDNKSSNTE